MQIFVKPAHNFIERNESEASPAPAVSESLFVSV